MSVILQSSLVLVLIGGIFGVRWLVTALKTRLYLSADGVCRISGRQETCLRIRTFAMAFAMVMAFLMVLLARSIQIIDLTVLVTGIVVGVVFILLRGKSYGVQRFYFLGAISVVSGSGLVLQRIAERLQPGGILWLDGARSHDLGRAGCCSAT
ncbi:MAG: hypothetical protein MZU97_07305 [Bacillus subtilis]|nr:hypothetical protein [Bacillus subtilis]